MDDNGEEQRFREVFVIKAAQVWDHAEDRLVDPDMSVEQAIARLGGARTARALTSAKPGAKACGLLPHPASVSSLYVCTESESSAAISGRPTIRTDSDCMSWGCAKLNFDPFRSRLLWRGLQAGESATYFLRPSPKLVF